MSPATSARHLSIVRPRMTYPPTRTRGLRGASLVRSLPVTFLFMNQANAKEQAPQPEPRRDPGMKWTQSEREPRIDDMAQQKEIISTINSLIETLKDGQEGFKQAAEAVKDSNLKSLFNEFSLQRAKFAGELQAEARQMGDSDPEDSEQHGGAMHRAWINIKSAVTSGDDHSILAECERGEDSAR